MILFSALVVSWIVCCEGCDVFVEKTGVEVVSAEYESTCLNLVPKESDWYSALQDCERGGGTLVSIYGDNFQQFIISTIRKHPRLIDWNFWIGVYQRKPKEHGGFQWTDRALNCDAHPSLPRHECSIIPSHALDKTECIKHKCCFLESNSPRCFYSPVRGSNLYYSKWTRAEKAKRHRLCGSLSAPSNYNWADLSCKSAFRQGYICQLRKPAEARSTDYTISWIIFLICLLLFILSLILCIVSACIIRKRLRRRPWWRRDSDDVKPIQNGSKYKQTY